MAYTTINKPSDYFNTKLYTGNESTNAITGVGFQPDFVWMKNRDSAYYHGLYDAVRGTGTSKSLYSNANETEGQNSGNMNLASFNSDGFTLGATSSTNIINKSSQNHVSWNWKANGTGSSNTDGTITSTVSANTTSGFSIAKYTGTGANASFGHGLGTTPAVYILKSLSGVSTWLMYHQSLGIGYHLGLNNTSAKSANDASFANNTAPDTSKIYLGNWGDLNANGSDFICYSFAEKQGYSKFGSYVGNGSTDGTFVYTGFKPAFVMMKNASQSGKWLMMDNKRPTSGGNPNNARLFADVSNVESTTSNMIDMLSNGFKIRTSDTDHNASGDINIYMAFASEPLVGDNPATAR